VPGDQPLLAVKRHHRVAVVLGKIHLTRHQPGEHRPDLLPGIGRKEVVEPVLAEDLRLAAAQQLAALAVDQADPLVGVHDQHDDTGHIEVALRPVALPGECLLGLLAVDLAAEPLAHQPQNLDVGGGKTFRARILAGEVERPVDPAAGDHGYPEVGLQPVFPVTGMGLPLGGRRMLETDRPFGLQCFPAVGIAELEYRARLDGCVGRDGLDDFVALTLDVREYADRQPELATARFKQRPDLVIERQVVCRGNLVQGAQHLLGLPALVHLVLQRPAHPLALPDLRLQLAVDILQLPRPVGNAFLQLVAGLAHGMLGTVAPPVGSPDEHGHDGAEQQEHQEYRFGAVLQQIPVRGKQAGLRQIDQGPQGALHVDGETDAVHFAGFQADLALQIGARTLGGHLDQPGPVTMQQDEPVIVQLAVLQDARQHGRVQADEEHAMLAVPALPFRHDVEVIAERVGMNEHLLVIAGGEVVDIGLAQASDLALEVIEHHLAPAVGDGVGKEIGEMPPDPPGELLPQHLVVGGTRQAADNVALLLGEQDDPLPDLVDIKLDDAGGAPRRVLHEGLLAVKVALVVPVDIEVQEKADQNQRKDNEYRRVVLHRAPVLFSGVRGIRGRALTHAFE